MKTIYLTARRTEHHPGTAGVLVGTVAPGPRFARQGDGFCARRGHAHGISVLLRPGLHPFDRLLGMLCFCLIAGAQPGLAGAQIITRERLRGVVGALFLCVVTIFAVGFGPTLIGIITDRLFGDPQRLNLSLLSVILILGSIGVVVARYSRGPTSRTGIDRLSAAEAQPLPIQERT